VNRWNRQENLARWLAEDDGIPAAVQDCFDLAPYRQQAAEIIERGKT
jgi:hypothetical protein